jgi:cytochrome c553
MKSTIGVSIFFLALGIASTSSSSAGELTISRFNDLKLNCDTCHGVGGHSPTPDQVPSLAGKSEKYLISQLQAFEKGKRQHQTMNFMGDSMSEEEMRVMAHFYSRGGK